MEYGQNKGDVWEIFYYTRKKIALPETEEQRFLDNQARELSSTFSPPKGLSPAEYSSLFLNHFMKARSDSRDIIEKNSELRIRNRSLFQVGNAECLADIEKIQASPDFHSWENQALVDYFRITSEPYL